MASKDSFRDTKPASLAIGRDAFKEAKPASLTKWSSRGSANTRSTDASLAICKVFFFKWWPVRMHLRMQNLLH